MNDLQMALIGFGLLAIACVLIYNRMQERRYFKQAEDIFKRDQRVDVLLSDGPVDDDALVGSSGAGLYHRDFQEPQFRVAAQTNEANGLFDDRVDYVRYLEFTSSRHTFDIDTVLNNNPQEFTHPLAWFVFDDNLNSWQRFSIGLSSEYSKLAATIQLVNRDGAVSEKQLEAFDAMVAEVGDLLMALRGDYAMSSEAHRRAVELDAFCARLDVQVVLNLVSRVGYFDLAMLHAIAKRERWLASNAQYQVQDNFGQTLFTISGDSDINHDGKWQTLSLTLDLPLVSNGVAAFRQMQAAAQMQAQEFDARLVDDNGVDFTDNSARAVCQQIDELQKQMHAGGMPPGSELAFRLFTI